MKEAQVKHTKFNIWIWRNLPPCREIVKLITASLDGKLSWRKKILMKIHLLSCDPCVNFLKQLKFLRGVLRPDCSDKLVSKESTPKLSDESRERIKNALKSSD
jgi:Putative zinc-finger